MKNLNEQFSDEEKQHLNYLGRPNTPGEQKMEDILEPKEKGSHSKAIPDELASRPDQSLQPGAGEAVSKTNLSEDDWKKDWKPGTYDYLAPGYEPGTHEIERGDVTWHQPAHVEFT